MSPRQSGPPCYAGPYGIINGDKGQGLWPEISRYPRKPPIHRFSAVGGDISEEKTMRHICFVSKNPLNNFQPGSMNAKNGGMGVGDSNCTIYHL